MYNYHGFTTLWIYTILKLLSQCISEYIGFTTLWIYTILKRLITPRQSEAVSLPYGFTLFSNILEANAYGLSVSLPYGFTLFSNNASTKYKQCPVSLPYGFTLFSN